MQCPFATLLWCKNSYWWIVSRFNFIFLDTVYHPSLDNCSSRYPASFFSSWTSATVSWFFFCGKIRYYRLFGSLLSFTCFFLLQGRILTVAGITLALCAAPFVAFANLVAIAVKPTWIAVAVSETLRKVCFLQELAYY